MGACCGRRNNQANQPQCCQPLPPQQPAGQQPQFIAVPMPQPQQQPPQQFRTIPVMYPPPGQPRLYQIDIYNNKEKKQESLNSSMLCFVCLIYIYLLLLLFIIIYDSLRGNTSLIYKHFKCNIFNTLIFHFKMNRLN